MGGAFKLYAVDSIYNELAYNEILLITKCLACHYIFPMFLLLHNSGYNEIGYNESPVITKQTWP